MKLIEGLTKTCLAVCALRAIIDTVKGKGHPRTGYEGPEGGVEVELYSFFNLGDRWGPAALPTGKTRYPLYRMLGGPQGRSEQVREISPPPGFDPRTVQLYRLRYPGAEK